MKFIVSYPQTNWDYVKFTLNRIVRGEEGIFKAHPPNRIFRIEPVSDSFAFPLLN